MMDSISPNHLEAACQMAAMALMGITLIRLATSSWLIGRVDEMKGDKRNLFRLDIIGTELRKELIATLVYQSLTLLQLPNFGTYMVEKGFVPKGAEKLGIKPKGRLWWVTVKDGKVVNRRILEDNGAINSFRPYAKECYTDEWGNLASQVIVCGEGLHDTMAPDECFKDEMVCHEPVVEVSTERRKNSRSMGEKKGGFVNHTGNHPSPSDPTPLKSNATEPQSYKVVQADGIKKRDIINTGMLSNAGYLDHYYNALKECLTSSYEEETIRDDFDVGAVGVFVAKIGSFIETAKRQKMGSTFRKRVWSTCKSVYPAIAKLRVRGSKGFDLGVKFEDLRYALQVYGILSEHPPGLIKDHKLIAINSSTTADILRNEVAPQIEALDTNGGKFKGYKSVSLAYIHQIADELHTREGCLNPIDRMLAVQLLMREFMVEVSKDVNADSEEVYTIYKWFIEATDIMKLVESNALAGRDLSPEIGISKVSMIVT